MIGVLDVAAEAAALAERVSRSVVHLECGGGSGSGVIWSSDGLLITNAHVMQRRKATATLWDGTKLRAQLCAHDPDRDLAAVQVAARELPAAQRGDAASLRVGQIVFAMGNPHGTDRALSAGVVHAVAPVRGRAGHPWVQADVRLHPGNSGGPLFDTSGSVVGINSMIAFGLALAVPVGAVLRFLKQEQPGPTLGIQIEPVELDRRRQAAQGLASRTGLLLVAVAPGSPAEQAGLLIGDVVSGAATSGQTIQDVDSLARLLSNALPGSALTLEIVRAGQRELRDVILAPWSSQRSAA